MPIDKATQWSAKDQAKWNKEQGGMAMYQAL